MGLHPSQILLGY